MMLFSDGAPLTPVGGSSWSLDEAGKGKCCVKGKTPFDGGRWRRGGWGDGARWSWGQTSKQTCIQKWEDEAGHANGWTRAQSTDDCGCQSTLSLRDDNQSQHGLVNCRDISKQPGSATFSILLSHGRHLHQTSRLKWSDGAEVQWLQSVGFKCKKSREQHRFNVGGYMTYKSKASD